MLKETDKKQGKQILENYIHENECNEYDHSGCSYPNNIVPDYEAEDKNAENTKIKKCSITKKSAAS